MASGNGKKEASVVSATDEIGLMSLDGSASGETNGAASVEGIGRKPNDPPVVIEKVCSHCGKSGLANQDLKMCNSCQCVWYCGAACQKAHWMEGAQDGVKQIREILDGQAAGEYPKTDKRCCDEHDDDDDSDIFQEPPMREDCVICMLPVPLDPVLSTYMACCGNSLCGGCISANDALAVQAKNKQTCPFCRSHAPASFKENFDRVAKKAGANHAIALHRLAIEYTSGWAVPIDEAKALKLTHRSAELGHATACSQLGDDYYNGVKGLESNKEKAEEYWKLAGKGGDVVALDRLGDIEIRRGERDKAVRYWRMVAALGHKLSTDNLILTFERGWSAHEDLADSRQARDKSRAEMRSEQRDQYVAYMKSMGKLNDAYA
mmetsp:Transcript_6718/g.18755  ORF Transcript_6718/g.18755 Transcript_6718/m.18755 type:complete len:377 (+) Transcript_6718:109-1239(+)